MFANKMKDESKTSFGSMIRRAKTFFLSSFQLQKAELSEFGNDI